jgi:hypothetical protein
MSKPIRASPPPSYPAYPSPPGQPMSVVRHPGGEIISKPLLVPIYLSSWWTDTAAGVDGKPGWTSAGDPSEELADLTDDRLQQRLTSDTFDWSKVWTRVNGHAEQLIWSNEDQLFDVAPSSGVRGCGAT